MQAYCETRLKKMLVKDKKDNPHKITNILKSEILYVLKNYFELQNYDIDIDIRIKDNGMYHLVIEAECRNIKCVTYIE